MKRFLALLLVFLFFLTTAAPDASSAATATATVPSAAAYLEGQLKAMDKRLYVFKDSGEGFNNFVEKVWVGSNNRNIPAMTEQAAGQSGTSGIRAEIDFRRHAWGGYLFANDTSAKAGMNLSGAAKLSFYARGEKGGEQVAFYMQGLNAAGKVWQKHFGSLKLTKKWKRYSISLKGLDLRRVTGGFGWTADIFGNGSKKIRFYIDNIQYAFSKARTQPLFLQSYASAKPGTEAARINSSAYLYDNAVAALALSYAGKHTRARQIADAMVYAQQYDRTFADGRLRNAYMAGDPRSAPGQKSPRGKAFAKLPGFYDPKAKEYYEDGYAVGTSTGNVAWAILGLCEVYRNARSVSGSAKYLQAAERAADFVLTLRDDKGGFTGGYEGWEGGQTKATYKSTEHNIDLIAAFGQLHSLTGKQKYADGAAHAKSFVLSVYDSARGCFYTGTEGDGTTVSKGVLPLDCQTWALLALGKSFTDAAAVLQFMEADLAYGEGYSFSNDRTRPGVWLEGTAQAAVAHLVAGIGTTGKAKHQKLLAFLNRGRYADGSIPAADRNFISTGYYDAGTGAPVLYGKRKHTGATAWLSFAQQGRNPLAV
ncbi:MAG: hypothetical protein LBD12_06280 [Clostridiales Family XIII bacterium]|jgi:hypothetical protein|nr:hypothetical protein [Clostridiales Family XIII bacterium]